MKSRMRKRLLMITVLIVVASTLSLTGAVLAQSSANYDLGCWGVFTAGGGCGVDQIGARKSSSCFPIA
ncbi:MAG: hypothetical protein HC802_18330, partial [Caldilineaceae bacterium]|nr:hypothetical protein [Caldilineaceae bacterium]